MRAGVHITERHKTFGIEKKGEYKIHCYFIKLLIEICCLESHHMFAFSLTALDSGEKQAQVDTSASSPSSLVEGKLEVATSGQPASNSTTLSVRQLVVRRGLAVLLMFTILAAGVFISELLIRLQFNKWLLLERTELHKTKPWLCLQGYKCILVYRSEKCKGWKNRRTLTFRGNMTRWC